MAQNRPALCRYRQDFESRYELKEKVGSGSFGTVYKVSSKQTGQEYASWP